MLYDLTNRARGAVDRDDHPMTDDIIRAAVQDLAQKLAAEVAEQLRAELEAEIESRIQALIATARDQRSVVVTMPTARSDVRLAKERGDRIGVYCATRGVPTNVEDTFRELIRIANAAGVVEQFSRKGGATAVAALLRVHRQTVLNHVRVLESAGAVDVVISNGAVDAHLSIRDYAALVAPDRTE